MITSTDISPTGPLALALLGLCLLARPGLGSGDVRKSEHVRYNPGDIVEGLVPEWGETWYEGEVLAVNDNGTYEIKWEADGKTTYQFSTDRGELRKKINRSVAEWADEIYAWAEQQRRPRLCLQAKLYEAAGCNRPALAVALLEHCSCCTGMLPRYLPTRRRAISEVAECLPDAIVGRILTFVSCSCEHGGRASRLEISESERFYLATRLPNIYGTPLCSAAAAGHLRMVRLLLDHEADAGATTACGRRTPLHQAALNGKSDVVLLLCDRGADPNAKTSSGNTPFHDATHAGTIRALLEANADIEARNNDGRTPLLSAARSCNPDAMRALLAAGAYSGATCEQGPWSHAIAPSLVFGTIADLPYHNHLRSRTRPMTGRIAECKAIALEELGTQREAAQAELAKQKKLVKLYYQVFCTPQRWKAQEAVRTEEKKIADLDKRIEEAKKSSPEPENSSSSEPADNQV